MTSLHAHKVMRKACFNPRDYGSMEVSKEQNEALRELALGVFTDCANKGLDFADCLTTILMTGLQFAVEASKDKP